MRSTEALYAVGVAEYMPEFGHLPYVMGQGNKKLSKRDPESHALFLHRERGFIPEGLLNYLSLLGWSLSADDRDIFTVEQLVANFDIHDVLGNPARFDLKKCDAINAAHMRLLSVEDMTHRVLPFLKADGVVSDPVNDADAQLLELAMPLVSERINKLVRGERRHAGRSCSSTRTPSRSTPRTPRSRSVSPGMSRPAGVVRRPGGPADVVDGRRSRRALQHGPRRRASASSRATPSARSAWPVTGRRISPPLFESLELLGRDRSLGRLQRALG